MKNSKLIVTSFIIGFLLTTIHSYAQVTPIVNIEFSQNIQNTGDSLDVTVTGGSSDYVKDRQNYTQCAIKLNFQEIVLENLDGDLFAQNSSFTISTWFRINNNGHGQYIIKTNDSYNYTGNNLSIGQGCINGFGVSTCRPITDYYTSVDTLTKWYHLALSVGIDSVRLYVNNVIVDKNKRAVSDNIINESTTIFEYFTGVVDNYKIFNVALSDEEVSELFHQTSVCDVALDLHDQENSFNIYNTNTKIHIEHPDPKDITIYNTNGLEIFQSKLINNTIDISSLSSGFYISLITLDDQIVKYKFVKH